MKTKLTIFLLAMAFVLTACSTEEERQMRNLQQFTTDLQTNCRQYSDEDWECALQEYEQITADMETCRFTDEERREIGKLKGKCLTLFSKYAMEAYKRDLIGTAKELEGTVEGVLDALNNAFDE